MSNIIYLSPANHTKPYATGHNEKQQMELVAKKVQSILSEYDCTVCYPTVFNNPGINGDYQGRPDEAKKLKADVYVSIHSNAAGTANSNATGCVGFYHYKKMMRVKNWRKRFSRSLMLCVQSSPTEQNR